MQEKSQEFPPFLRLLSAKVKALVNKTLKALNPNGEIMRHNPKNSKVKKQTDMTKMISHHKIVQFTEHTIPGDVDISTLHCLFFYN